MLPPPPLSPSGIADPARRAAALVHDAFDDYNARFSDITRRARRSFELRDCYRGATVGNTAGP